MKNKGNIMKTKTIQNKLLQFKSDEIDGQDYETVANLIKGNQFIAAFNFIDRLDTSPRDHMKQIIEKQPSLYYEIFAQDEYENNYLGQKYPNIYPEFAQ
tara:strand:- start:65 stop:361 length:297 start_codon:yes stop_codon:yes gene_type:complete